MLRFLSKFKPCNEDGVERAIMLACLVDPRKYLGEHLRISRSAELLI